MVLDGHWTMRQGGARVGYAVDWQHTCYGLRDSKCLPQGHWGAMERSEQGFSPGFCVNMRKRWSLHTKIPNVTWADHHSVGRFHLDVGSGQRAGCCWHVICLPFTHGALPPCQILFASECLHLQSPVWNVLSQLSAALARPSPFISDALPSYSVHCLGHQRFSGGTLRPSL